MPTTEARPSKLHFKSSVLSSESHDRFDAVVRRKLPPFRTEGSGSSERISEGDESAASEGRTRSLLSLNGASHDRTIGYRVTFIFQNAVAQY
jgi:hypothetical protein